MTESIASFLTFIDFGDSLAAFSFLDKILANNQVDEFSVKLERVIEWDGRFTKYQLKLRDIIAEYLGFREVYFGIQIPSYEIFRMVAGASTQDEARALLFDTIFEQVKSGGSQVDLSQIEIESLKNPPYVVLTPFILSERAKEFESCKIYFSVYTDSEHKKYRFFIAELLNTHYGRKFANAFKFDSEYPIIGKDDFSKLKEILQSFGYDVESNMVEVSMEEWPYFIVRKMRSAEKEFMSSTELWLLYQTYTAMIRLESDDANMVRDALNRIDLSKTKFCSNELVSLVATGSPELQLLAIELLAGYPDFSQIDSLCSLLPETEGVVRNFLIKAISTMESAKFFVPKDFPPTQVREIPTPHPRDPELVENYMAALDQLSRSFSSEARIDAARALSKIQIAGVESHLQRLMHDEDPRVRLAVLDASKNLRNDQAECIIRQGILDDDSLVEKEALRLFEERWPDSYW
ncbi:MAG: HEAT repeat domain-containing protein [Promethearchaeota archaeon]